MSPTPVSTGRRGTLAVAAVGAVLALGGTYAVVTSLPAKDPAPAVALTTATSPEPTAPAAAAPTTGPSVAPDPAASTAPALPPGQDLDTKTMARARPVGLSIPSIGVASDDLIELGKEADGTLEVPVDYAQPGWYEPGPAPGEFGPAVIAGHVDSKRGPAIFYRLGELRPGDRVSVARADGTTAEFEIDKVERYRKDDFPTAAVYSDTTQRSELRLITCGGAFDSSTGSYVDNVVAYAHLV